MVVPSDPLKYNMFPSYMYTISRNCMEVGDTITHSKSFYRLYHVVPHTIYFIEFSTGKLERSGVRAWNHKFLVRLD